MDFSDAHQADRRSEVSAEQLGPYALIAEISSGDFTTVHLAHKAGAHGFDRLVAIKRLKPAFARQPEWSQLLLDEARLGASVDHPNTVDILDVGTDAGVYVVMDYVEGADLEQLLARAGRERHPRYILPPIIDALTGLHAIHTQRDELGEPLAMVHQAPRARHILVSIHGNARVTDFSQVTARGLIPSTLRGKGLSPAYMAPEQVLVSEPVSARTDVFILGITLWEALTGERLFVGETPSLVRRSITERDIPKPSEVGLLPPRCFDGVVMRALQRNAELRYQSAAEMARDLRQVAQEEALLASASELGQWVRALASRSLIERRRALGVDEKSQEIDAEVLEQHLAADRARASQPPPERDSIPFARDSILVPIEDVPAPPATKSAIDAHVPVTPAITVPVANKRPPKREPTQPLRTPAVEQRRTATGTLLGVTAKPRSIGLPPPAAAALQARATPHGVPAYTGSLHTTTLEAPRVEIKPGLASAPTKHTLPEGGAFISELSLPIDLPAASPGSTPAFAGFDEMIDLPPPPVVTTPSRRPTPKTQAWQEVTKAGFGSTAEFGGAAAAVPPGGDPVLEAAEPLWPPPPAAPSWNAPAGANTWTTPPARRPPTGPVSAYGVAGAPLGATRDEKRRAGEPTVRGSRPPMQQTLDGNVPDDVFERLRAASGGDSWRPPAQAVRQPWSEEEYEVPRGHGRKVALAAAILVAGFFGYQALSTPSQHAPVTPTVHAAGGSGVREFDPMALNRQAHEAEPAPTQAEPPPAAVPEPVAPTSAVPPPVVPPVSFGSWASQPSPAAPVERPHLGSPPVRRAAPRLQLRHERPFTRPAHKPEALPDNPY